MPEFFAQPDDLGDLRASQLHSSLGESLGAQAGEAFMSGTRTLYRLGEYAHASGNPVAGDNLSMSDVQNADDLKTEIPDVSADDAKARLKQEGLDGLVTMPNQPSIKKPVLDLMVQHGHEKRDYDAAVSRGPQGFVPGALGLVTSLGAGIIDPVNLAAFSIPVVGEARFGMMMAAAGDSLLGRAGVRAAVGGAQGAVGAGALLPGEWWLHTRDGQDFTMADALHSVVMGAGMGAGMHAGIGAFRDVRARSAGNPLEHSPEAQLHDALRSDPYATAEPLAPDSAIGETAPGIGAGENNAPAGSVEALPSNHPAQILNDLPPRAREDVVRSAIADIVQDRPVRAGQMLQEAAKEDPRIAESLQTGIRLMPEEGADSVSQLADRIYKIMGADGTQVGGLHVELQGERAVVQGIWSVDEAGQTVPTAAARNSLGPSAVRVLLRQFREEHPEVKTLVANRVSGARFGGEEDELAGQRMAVHLPEPRQSPSKAKGPQSLLQFIAARGGIDPKDPLAADLLQSFGGKNPTIRGHGKLIREGGQSLDALREGAVEAGYLHDGAAEHGGATESTIQHLLDGVDREARGEKQYPAGHEGHLTKEQLEARGELEQHQREQTARDNDAAFETALDDREIGTLRPQLKRLAQTIMDRGEHDPTTAMESALRDYGMLREAAPEPPARADWQKLGDVREAYDDPRAIEESNEAARTPEPASIEPEKAPSAAEAAAKDAEQLLNDMKSSLTEEEWRSLQDSLDKVDRDKGEREEIVRDGAACLAAAAAA